MFKKLRNKLILINLGITTLVIVVAFTLIYMIFTRSAENRPPKMQGMSEIIKQEGAPEKSFEEWEQIIQVSIKEEKQTAARDLLVTLIVSGLVIEIMVALISYYMAEEAIKPVKEAYEAQKVFIANASHEIKTPLAAISANLEAADIKNNKWIDNVEKEANKLAALNTELLTLARTDLVSDITSEVVDLAAVTNKILDGFEPRLKNQKLTKEFNLTKKVKINVEDYSKILSILMDNAVKYSNKKILVVLNDHSLEISNDGAKISADKLPYVFDRFYQADKSAEGVGLGLSIAKSLAERNHFKLVVKSDKLTTFILNF